jgi:hypothetical protein
MPPPTPGSGSWPGTGGDVAAVMEELVSEAESRLLDRMEEGKRRRHLKKL